MDASKEELTPEQKLERRKQYKKEWYLANKERIKAKEKKIYPKKGENTYYKYKKFYDEHHKAVAVSAS
jgi:hypothetical protein